MTEKCFDGPIETKGVKDSLKAVGRNLVGRIPSAAIGGGTGAFAGQSIAGEGNRKEGAIRGGTYGAIGAAMLPKKFGGRIPSMLTGSGLGSIGGVLSTDKAKKFAAEKLEARAKKQQKQADDLRSRIKE